MPLRTSVRSFDGLTSSFLDELCRGVLRVLRPSNKSGSAHHRRAPPRISGLISASAGETIDEDVRTEAETRLGHSFSSVRVHHDAAAAAASERMNANAFAVGGDVFFGAGKFSPGSSEGRRLLYHELTHTVQQAARGGLALQPDYKDLLKRLAKRFSSAVIAELKGATTSSPSKQKQITDIQDKVAKLIGREVVSRDNPKLPTGYIYIPKDKGRIKTIRRTLAWIRFLPALTIKKKRIRLAALLSSYDPKDAARAALRRALGCDSSIQEAHHVIPLELYMNDVVRVATANGYTFNGVDNGVCISNRIHSGSHPKYTDDVLARLAKLKTGVGMDWAKLQKPFLAMVATLKAEVKARRKKLT